jgi:hypothetical protein
MDGSKNLKTSLSILIILGIAGVLALAAFFMITTKGDETKMPNQELTEDYNKQKVEEDKMTSLVIAVGEQKFDLRLADTDAAQEIAKATPFEIEMSELNGNEKYYYGENLPSNPQAIGQIHAGDLMLYGDDCIVLFYKDFQTTYSYTRLGHISDPTGLAEALGDGDVNVIFTKQ